MVQHGHGWYLAGYDAKWFDWLIVCMEMIPSLSHFWLLGYVFPHNRHPLSVPLSHALVSHDPQILLICLFWEPLPVPTEAFLKPHPHHPGLFHPPFSYKKMLSNLIEDVVPVSDEIMTHRWVKSFYVTQTFVLVPVWVVTWFSPSPPNVDFFAF